jgi:NADH-quinone oxidoreductase subunit M
MENNVLNLPILSLVTFSPLLGALIILFLKQEQQIKWVALVASLLALFISLLVLSNFDASDQPQLVERRPWIGVWGVEYYLGVDGVSLWLLMLTTLISPIAIASSFTAIQERVKEYYILLLLAQTALTGVLLALDMFLFYVFWGFSLAPLYLLVVLWGGPRRVYAATKFFLYTLAGSVFMLLAILYLGQHGNSFAFPDLAAQNARWVGSDDEMWLFLAFAAAFASRAALWPLHSWLPDAHEQAPTAVSIMLSGLVLNTGAFGLLRFNLALFPQAAHDAAPAMAALSIIGIAYGAMVAFAQADVKKLLAYYSASQMGLVILGIFARNEQGAQGSVLHMLNHGLIVGALFLLLGALDERRHTRDLNEFGGLYKIAPRYGAIALFVTLAALGLPGSNGFVGQFAVLRGAYARNWAWAAFAAAGLFLSAVCVLTMFQKIFLGQSRDPANASLADQPLQRRELAALVPLLLLMLLIGLYPAPFFSLMDMVGSR